MLTPLPPSSLYRACDPTQFAFNHTAELDELTDIIGQERALASVRFGVGIPQEGFNLFALGPNGTGKFTAISQFIKQKAAAAAVPSDYCYVFDFEQPHRPKALQLHPGQGTQLAELMQKLINDLFTVLPTAFESEDYNRRKIAIEEEYRDRQEQAIEAIRRHSREQGIALIATPNGLAFAPLQNNEVISPEQFMRLPEEEQRRIEAEVGRQQEALQKVVHQMPQWKRETQGKLDLLNQEVAEFAVKPLFEEIRQRFADMAALLSYLDALQKDVTEKAWAFLDGGGSPLGGSGGDHAAARQALLTRYKVNVLVDHSQTQGAPIVYEDNPSYQNLVGRVEYESHQGSLITDFTLVRSGALHRANGGYLLLDARKLLTQPYAWEGLKRALRAREINLESLGQALGLISTVSLEPEPIPLDVKVALMGEPLLYYLLCQYDPDFMELFKVTVDFDLAMPRTGENDQLYAQLIGTLAHKNGLRPFDRSAVARVIEQSARLADDAERLSLHMQSIADLLREADYWAGEAGKEMVDAAAIQQAIEAQQYRGGRLRERIQEAILRETLLIDTQGGRIGQINGLSVFLLGGQSFGKPSRITAQVRLGKGDVVDIERQVELGGPLHSKGVLILSSFLSSRYAQERPLALSASLVFEQSYGGIDGDSASSAELYALLSSLAELPLKQALAVTGSVNQHGEVQAIGGVNEKIEGFFDICQARGLTGDQGVLIPAANVKNLMLRQDVVAAAAQGQFHIYPITHIDEGISLLTGVPIGEPDEQGQYPPGSINQRIIIRLDRVAEKVKAFNQGKDRTEG
ncbi:MAG: Lon protease family protein [Anaerolineae bacterium]|nr:Lon protease family protein [Anaerolineae bacterium]